MADNQPNNGGAVQPGTAEIKPQDQKTEAPSKPAEVKITSDDIEFKSLDIMQELGYSSRAKKKPEESEQKKEEKNEEPAKPGDKPKTTPEAEKKVEPEVKPTEPGTPEAKTKEAASFSTFDPIETGKVIARETARAVRENLKGIQPAKEEVREQPYSRSEQRFLDVFQHMENRDPSQKGLVEKFKHYLSRKAVYQEQWQKENPDKKFNIDDPEHETFVDAACPSFDPEEFDDARVEMITTRSARSILADQERAQKEKENAEQAEQATRDYSSKAVQGMFEAIAPEMKENWNNIGAIEEKDPVLAAVIEPEIENLNGLISDLIGLTDLGQKFNPKNKNHKAINERCDEIVRMVMKMPPHERLNDQGQSFISPNQYQQLPKEERSQYWTLDNNGIITYLTMISAKKVQAKLEKVRSANKVASKPAQDKDQSIPAVTKPAAEKSGVPSTASKTDAVNNDSKIGEAQISPGKLIVQGLWG